MASRKQDLEGLASSASVFSERLYTLLDIATQHHLGDEGRIRAILAEACKVLEVETALVGEIAGCQYFVRYAHDPKSLIKAGTEISLTGSPPQIQIVGKRSSLGDNLPQDGQLVELPLVTNLKLKVYAGSPVWPIWVNGSLWGVLAFAGHSVERHKSKAEDKAFIELIANWVGLLQTQVNQRAKLELLALTDELTGLPNRRAAENRLREEIARARRIGQTFVLALADLDHFKLVNDRYGHSVGDEVLIGFANLFKEHLRADDWVARWGGEEFLVCLHDAGIVQAESVLDRLRIGLSKTPFSTSAGQVFLTMSAGLNAFNLEDITADSVLASLDSALYEAKSRGRDQIVVASEGLGILRMATLLKAAAAENRILTAYQPMVDLRTRKVVADEALVRLKTPQGEILPAAAFIDAAEGLNLMAEIDNVVTASTMSRCVMNLSEGRTEPGFSHFVNLSPQFLARRDYVERLLRRAQEYCGSCGLEMEPVKPLVLEITERQAIVNLDMLEQDLRYLLDFGFRLALDDFGSGYSSLHYLSRLPISFLKIEGWMIGNIHHNSKSLALVRSLADFAHGQGITTIAEGVENAETADLLQEIGVDWAQGYYFGAPVLD